MSGRDEQAIIAAVLRGDRERYRELVERHHAMLHGLLVRLLADPVLAADIAHETFVRAYGGLEGFRGRSSFSTWLVQIGINLARDELRRRRRRPPTVSLDQRLEDLGHCAEPADENRRNDTLDCLCRQESDRLLLSALARLPLQYREVLTLRYFNDWSFAEIADVTGESVGTLKVRAHRARLMLRDQMIRDEKRGRLQQAIAPTEPPRPAPRVAEPAHRNDAEET